MARTAKLVDIRTRVYQRADIENEIRRFPVAEVNGYINESYTDLYDVILRARGTTYNDTSTTFTTVAGQSVYALPATFYQLVAQPEFYNGTHRYPLERFQRDERPMLADTNVGWRGWPYLFALTGANIEILPAPTAAGMTFTIRYVPTPTSLVNDNDTLDGVDGWEEYVVVDAARKCATKQNDAGLVSILAQDLRRLEERIKALAGARDRAGPKHVTDVRGGRLTRVARRWIR